MHIKGRTTAAAHAAATFGMMVTQICCGMARDLALFMNELSHQQCIQSQQATVCMPPISVLI